MKLYRIGLRDFPIFSGYGATVRGGRWNSPGLPVIYAAQSLAGARFELLARIGFNGKPENYGYIEIVVPDGLTVVKYPKSVVPSEAVSRRWGDGFLRQGKSAIALVPSAASPGEFNALINPSHPDFRLIKVSAEYPAKWDSRHFKRAKRRK